MCGAWHPWWEGRRWPVEVGSVASLAEFVGQRRPAAGWIYLGALAQMYMGPHKHECVYFVADGRICADRRAA